MTQHVPPEAHPKRMALRHIVGPQTYKHRLDNGRTYINAERKPRDTC